MISFLDVLRVIIISIKIGGGECSFPYWVSITGHVKPCCIPLGFLLFPWVDFLRGESSEAYPTQYCCNLRAGCFWVRVQIPGQVEV